MDRLPSARQLFTRATLRTIGYNDRHGNLNRLYRLEDPWNMAGERERARFEETNSIVAENFPSVGTLLEIGCGEGHQSLYLSDLAETLVGIDISERAVARARQRCPDGRFEAAALESSKLVVSGRPFDLVVAAEVLYYMSDPAAFLTGMSRMGRGCLVTYWADHAARLDPLVAEQPLLGTREIRHEDALWRVAWWEGAAGAP